MDRKDIIFHCKIEVTEHVVKKNGRNIFRNRATGQLFPGKSAKLVMAENHLIKELRQHWWAWPAENKTPINYPVNVTMIFYFNKAHYFTKKGNVNKKLPDLSNLYQIVEDSLEDAKILENDHFICGHDASRRVPTNSELDPNSLEIIITKL